MSRWTGPYLVTEQLYDFRGEEPAPSSWLKKETGLTEHLQALAVKDGSSSISGVSMTPGDRPSDMNQEEAKEVNVRIAPRRARVEFPRSDFGDKPKTI